MPIARFEMPDGRIARFEVPEGTTPDAAQSMIKGYDFGAASAPQAEQPVPQSPEQGIGRTAFDQSMQGATFGFADEVQNRIGAGIASVATGEKYSDLLNEANTMSKERLAAQVEQRPALSIASGLAGGLVTGGAAASTKAGGMAGNLLRTGGAGARIAKGAVAGATTGALYGAGAADEGNRIEGAKSGAILGGVVGGAVPAVGAAVKGVFTKTAQTTSDDIAKLANQAYRTAEQKGGVLTPQFTDKFITELDKFTPQTSAGKMLAGDSPVTKITERISALRGQPLTLQAAQEVDEFLGDAIDGFTEMGRLTKQGKKLLDIQTSFRNMIDSAGVGDVVGKEGFDSLKQGRQLWSGAARLRDVEKIITRAELSDNPATAIKSGFRTLYSNPSRLRGYSESERALIKRAAETGVVADTLRVAGSRLIPIISGSTGGLGGAAIGQATSTLARGGATKLQAGRAAKVASEIANNTLAKSGMQKAAQSAPSRITPTIGLAGSGAAGTVAGAEARAALPMAKTPPVTLPNATQPSTMEVVPFEQMLPEAQPVQALPETKPQSSLEGTISDAAQIGGANPDLLQGIAQIESSMNPEAKAKTSSASGLFQITAPTWKALVMRYGKKHGFGMGDIMKPEANAKAAALLTSENNQKLATKLGREPDAAESYTAHFLGANKAVKLLNAEPRQIAAKLLPAEAKANEAIFYYKDGKPRDVMAVRMLLSDKINGAMKQQSESRMQAEQQAKMAEEQGRKNAMLQAMASKIPQESIQALRGNPSLAGDFNQMYGDGTSSLFLT